MKRPNFEMLIRTARRGVQMEIPQATDMLYVIEYAILLENRIAQANISLILLQNQILGTANGSDGAQEHPAGGTKA